MNIELVADEEIIKKKFYGLKTRQDVADLLEVTDDTLIYYLYRGVETYTSFKIKKRTGGYRDILAPIPQFKIIQSKLAFILSLIYKPKTPAHGFIGGRSIITNAQYHTKKKLVFNIDLKDFFPSINFGRVYGMFMGNPHKFPKAVATVLAQICCHDSKLPQGAPTSPIISNMICRKLDDELIKLARKYTCGYTRYADDITFSTTGRKFSDAVVKTFFLGVKLIAEPGEQLRSIIKANYFDINENKVSLKNSKRRQCVTGLVVNKKVNVKRSYINQVRAMLHAWDEYGYDDAEKEHHKKFRDPAGGTPSFSNVIKGKISFIKSVRTSYDVVYRRLINEFNRLSENGIPPYSLTVEEEIKNNVWVIECGRGVFSSGFMLRNYGLITCAHSIKKNLDERERIRVFRCINNENWEQNQKNADVVWVDENRDLAILIVDADIPEWHKFEIGGEPHPYDDRVIISGFPNYRRSENDIPNKIGAKTSGIITEQGNRLIRIDKILQRGQSGSVVLDADNLTNSVVGVVNRGAQEERHLRRGELEFTFIPISALPPQNEIEKRLILFRRKNDARSEK